MITAVLESSERTTGVMSRYAIVQAILKSFPVLTGPRFVSSISRGLKQGLERGIIVRVSGNLQSGSYKLSQVNDNKV